MGRDYEGYLKRRIESTRIVSWAEAELLAIADGSVNAPSSFYMVHTNSWYYLVYDCQIEKARGIKPKIRIKSISQDITFNLPSPEVGNCSKDIIDTAFKSLYALGNSAPIAITGKYAKCDWLLKTLKLFFKVIVDVPDYIDYKPEMKGRISIIPQLKNSIVSVNRPNTTLYNLLNNSQPIYIPLCESTLSAKFYSDVTWKDIIGDERKTVEIEGVKCIPAYINTEIDGYNNVFVCFTYILNPNVKRRILVVKNGKLPLNDPTIKHIVDNSLTSKPEALSDHFKAERVDKKIKNASFRFNDVEYDVQQLKKAIPKMGRLDLAQWRHNVQTALQMIVNVKYIVTDTNNWCTYDKKASRLKYEGVLERMGGIIERNKLNTKFYVISEVLTELKRLTGKKEQIGARLGQRLLSHNFTQRGLIKIPNPDEKIAYNIIADNRIRLHIQSLYLRGEKLSVISNDRQAMMIWQATIENLSSECSGDKSRLFFPKFISLENIGFLFTLWDIIKKNNN